MKFLGITKTIASRVNNSNIFNSQRSRVQCFFKCFYLKELTYRKNITEKYMSREIN